MNRAPIGPEEATKKKGEGLARLAAIADVVARQRKTVAVPGPDRSETAAMSMQKRSINTGDDDSAPLKKRARTEEKDGADGNEKVIQFRQVSCCRLCVFVKLS